MPSEGLAHTRNPNISRSVSVSSPAPEAISENSIARFSTPDFSSSAALDSSGFDAMTTQSGPAAPGLSTLSTESVSLQVDHRQSTRSLEVDVSRQPTPTTITAWPPDLVAFTSSFVLSANSLDHEKQISEIRNLRAKFGDRIAGHRFDWMKYATGTIIEEWLPRYTYKVNVTISEIWEEYTTGLDGCLSTRQLDEHWCARWRRNINGLKTENSRRKQIITLIETLKNRPNWNVDLALRFLKEEYPIPSSSSPHLKSVRRFTEHLQSKANGDTFRKLILDAATEWTRH